MLDTGSVSATRFLFFYLLIQLQNEQNIGTAVNDQ